MAMFLCGLGDPVLWGAAAFLLNFVPILGPFVGVGVFLLAGLSSFDELWQVLLPAGLYLLIHLVESAAVTPISHPDTPKRRYLARADLRSLPRRCDNLHST